MCNTKTLSQKGATFISYCAGCSTVCLYHRNLLLTFSEEEFLSFRQVLQNFSFEKCAQLFPDGEKKLLIQTPQRFVSMAFSQEEWHDLHEALDMAQHMQTVYQLVASAL